MVLPLAAGVLAFAPSPPLDDEVDDEAGDGELDDADEEPPAEPELPFRLSVR